MTVTPAQIPCEPASSPETAAARCIPGVCAVFRSNSCGFTTRTVGFSTWCSAIACPPFSSLSTWTTQAVTTDNVSRAFPHAQAQPARFGATPQLRCLALSSTSIKRKCHESVTSIVMDSVWLTNIVNRATSRHRRQVNKKDGTLLFRNRFDFGERSVPPCKHCTRGLRLGGTETRKRNVAILGYRREKRSFFYPQKPLQKQEKQNNVFCEAGFPERTRTNAGRNRKVEAFSPSPKPQKSMAEKLLTSPIAHLS